MKAAFTKVVLAALFIVLPQLAGTATACTCMPIPSPYKSLQQARAVFAGKIISATDVPFTQRIRDKTFTHYERSYRVAVTESFKGAKATEVEVNIGRTDSSCYVGFEVGESYLIYAYGDSDAALGTHMCTRTNNLAGSLDEVHHLRAMLQGAPEPRLYGSVSRIDDDLKGRRGGLSTPLEGIKVVVEGAGRRVETITDKRGLFSIAKLPDGKYRARPLLPDNYASGWPAAEEFILGPDARPEPFSSQQGSSAYAKFRVRWNNSLSGKILDAEGNLIKRAKVSILAVRNGGAAPSVIREDPFDYRPTGSYDFSGLTPGKYILSLSITAPFPPDRPTRFYYPSAADIDEASEIAVGEKGSLAFDLMLPAGYVVRPVEGLFIWSDGSPVDDGWVYLAEPDTSEDGDGKYDWTGTDRQGRFSLQGFAGAVYWLHASVGTLGMKTADGGDLWDSGTHWLRARPIKIEVGKSKEPLRIVVPLPEGVSKRK